MARGLAEPQALGAEATAGHHLWCCLCLATKTPGRPAGHPGFRDTAQWGSLVVVLSSSTKRSFSLEEKCDPPLRTLELVC